MWLTIASASPPIRSGPVTVATFGQLVFERPRGAGHLLVGAGADGLIRIGREARPYLTGGVSGGFLDLRAGSGLALWHGWSAGAGIEIVRFAGVALGAEARYQSVSRDRVSGVSGGIRIGRPIGTGLGRRPPAAAVPLGTATRGSRAEVTTALAAALEAMGTPYQWGGTTQNGFDCSGLIQYAYAKAGIGVALDDLAPGDILAFAADRGGTVSHVGPYLGHGRFIHGARDGVVVSSLSSDDITGRWWLDRWVDSRRLID